MKTTWKIAATAAGAIAATALFAAPANATTFDRAPLSSRGTVFVQNDATSENTIFAYDRSSGLLYAVNAGSNTVCENDPSWPASASQPERSASRRTGTAAADD